MNDTTWAIIIAAGLLLAVLGAKSFFLPPKCAKCGNRYDHEQHDECPYCVPLKQSPVTGYVPLFLLCAAIVCMGIAMSSGEIIGAGIGLFVMIFIVTQLRIPWAEIFSVRVLIIALVGVGIVIYFSTTR